MVWQIEMLYQRKLRYTIVSYENIYRNKSSKTCGVAGCYNRLTCTSKQTSANIKATIDSVRLLALTTQCRKCLHKFTVATAGKTKCFYETRIHKQPLFYSILRHFNPVSYPISLDPFQRCPFFYAWVSKMTSSNVFRLKFCMHFFCLLALHALSISSSLIWLP